MNREISIEKIVLGMMVVGEKDNSEGMLAIPVWDFIGTQTVDYLVGGLETASGVSFMTINAIDGSIIDRSLGY